MNSKAMDGELVRFLSTNQLEAFVGMLSAMARALLSLEPEKKKTTLPHKLGIFIGSTILAVIIAHVLKESEAGPKWVPVCAAAATGILAQHLMTRIVKDSTVILDAVEGRVKDKFCKSQTKDDNE